MIPAARSGHHTTAHTRRSCSSLHVWRCSGWDAGETNAKGLYVAGEVACTGLQGANRLASNSLLEALVFAQRAVQPSIDHMVDADVDPCFAAKWARPMLSVFLRDSTLSDIIERTKKIRMELQSIMWECIGIVRSTNRLKNAEWKIGDLKSELVGGVLLQDGVEAYNGGARGLRDEEPLLLCEAGGEECAREAREPRVALHRGLPLLGEEKSEEAYSDLPYCYPRADMEFKAVAEAAAVQIAGTPIPWSLGLQDSLID